MRATCCSPLGVLFLVAQVPPQQLMRFAVPLYIAGLLLLIATALPGIGLTKQGRDPLAQHRRRRSSRARS